MYIYIYCIFAQTKNILLQWTALWNDGVVASNPYKTTLKHLIITCIKFIADKVKQSKIKAIVVHKWIIKSVQTAI